MYYVIEFFGWLHLTFHLFHLAEYGVPIEQHVYMLGIWEGLFIICKQKNDPWPDDRYLDSLFASSASICHRWQGQYMHAVWRRRMFRIKSDFAEYENIHFVATSLTLHGWPLASAAIRSSVFPMCISCIANGTDECSPLRVRRFVLVRSCIDLWIQIRTGAFESGRNLQLATGIRYTEYIVHAVLHPYIIQLR